MSLTAYDRREVREMRIEAENILTQFRWIEDERRNDREREFRFAWAEQGARRLAHKARNAEKRYAARNGRPL